MIRGKLRRLMWRGLGECPSCMDFGEEKRTVGGHIERIEDGKMLENLQDEQLT